MITKIENYCLNQAIEEVSDLKEYTEEEYQMFALAGYKRMLRDEKIYHGKKTNLNGSLWDTVIGTTDGKIYKISLQIIDANKNRIENIFKSTLDYMIKEMGKYNEHPFSSEKYYWDAPEGNIIFEQLSKFGQHCINIFITSSSIRGQVYNYFSIILRKIMNLFQNFGWNPLEHSDEENLRWSWLRAVEWGIWPAFLSGPIAPLLFPFFSWWKVICVIEALTILWSFVRYRFVNLAMAGLGVYFVLLKWVVCPLAAIYLVVQHNYILAILSFFWPALAGFLGIFVGRTQIGKIQKMFMAKLGYLENK